MRKEHGADRSAHPQWVISTFVAAYPCDENVPQACRGDPCGTRGRRATPDQNASKVASWALACSINSCTVTQTRSSPRQHGDDPTCGLVFDTCRGDTLPCAQGLEQRHAKDPRQWHRVSSTASSSPALRPRIPPVANPFAPEATVVPQKAPLVVYLHGAGEGKGSTQGEGADARLYRQPRDGH